MHPPLRAVLGFVCAVSSLWACGVKLSTPKDAVIECDRGRCPKDWVCAPGLNRCVPPGAQVEAPALQVAFSEPADGAQDVSVRPTLVVAFSTRVDVATLTDRIRLRLTGGGEIPLTRNPDDLGNVFRFSLAPGDSLTGEAAHVLTVEPGVEPAAGELSRPMTATFTAAFRTGPAPDLTAPAPIADLVVEQLLDRFLLTWSGATDAAGYLVVRRQGGVASAAPIDGITYTAGTTLGDADVVAVTATPGVTDPGATSPPYEFVVFAYDAALNYSAGRRAPFLAAEALVWCTDETGSFRLDSPNAASQQLWLADSPTVPFGSGTLYPTTGVAPSTNVDLPVGDPIAVGQTYSVRPVLRSAEGELRGLIRAFSTPSATLTITQEPLAVGVGGTSTMRFDPNGWTSFAAEVDTDPRASMETFGPAAVNNAVVSAVLPSLGEYRFRVRPTLAGCVDAPWTVSAPVTVGSFLYVSPFATGDGSGRDPANAMTTIQGALTAAPANTTIFVIGSDYRETLHPTSVFNVLLEGGYAADFSARDPVAYPTRVLSSSASAPLEADVAGGLSTFDALVFINDHTAGCAVNVTTGSPTLRACEMRGTLAALCVSGAVATPVVEDSWLVGTGAADSVAASISADAAPGVRRSHLEGGSGTTSSTGLLLGNVEGRYEANEIDGGNGGIARGVVRNNLGYKIPLLVNNVIRGGNATHTTGVEVNGRVRLSNNTIDGGTALGESVAIDLRAGNADLVNGILTTSAGATRICIWCRGASASFGYLLHSALVECPTARLLDPTAVAWEVQSGGTFGESMGSDMPDCTMDAESNGGSEGHAGMMTFTARSEMAFAADGWHLTSSSPAAVRLLGRDANLALCGQYCGEDPPPDCSCGAVTADKDGEPRTCPAAATDCFSVGADELD